MNLMIDMVRGYHMYREIWLATVGEELYCVREVGNYRDLFAVRSCHRSRPKKDIVGVLDVFS